MCLLFVFLTLSSAVLCDVCVLEQQQFVALSNCRSVHSQQEDDRVHPYIGHEAETMRQAVTHTPDYTGACFTVACIEVI